VKTAYIEFFGPLGIKQFQKLGERVTIVAIIRQVNELQEKGITTPEEMEAFKNKVSIIFNK
jgi:hypothetical protein